MAVFVALCIHELGHIIAAIILRIKYEKVKITFLGFNLKADTEHASFIKKFILFIAGPACNITCYFIYKFTKYNDFAEISLFLSCINLFPIVPLDGGNICKAVLECKIDDISICRYMIMTNSFFIVCFLVIIYISRNYLFLLLILMALNGIINENDHMVEKSIRYSYSKIKRKNKFL